MDFIPGHRFEVIRKLRKFRILALQHLLNLYPQVVSGQELIRSKGSKSDHVKGKEKRREERTFVTPRGHNFRCFFSFSTQFSFDKAGLCVFFHQNLS